MTLYLIPETLRPSTISSELSTDSAHEWISLPVAMITNLDSDEINDKANADLPDLIFLLQGNTLGILQEMLLSRSGVREVKVKREEISYRTENEFGLIFSKSLEIVEILVGIV